jgi:uncharacterized protein YgiM (DUF1202 family)
MLTRTLKTAALATALVIATAGASMAAQYVWVDHDTWLYEHKSTGSDHVGYADEGEKVKLLQVSGSWAKINDDGDIGWVKKSKLDWAPTFVDYPYDDYPYGGSGSFCAGGSSASFCFSVGY